MPFHAQVHATFGFVKEALAVARRSLDDVVDCQLGSRTPRISHSSTRSTGSTLPRNSRPIGISHGVHVQVQT
jgi:hypothetical protein